MGVATIPSRADRFSRCNVLHRTRGSTQRLRRFSL
jgi:hypothetical protein